jgi:hypothetical protein
MVQLFLKTLTNRLIVLDVENDDTIYDVKLKIQSRENRHPDQQRIIFCGEDLEDTKTIGECDLTSGPTIYLIFINPKD